MNAQDRYRSPRDDELLAERKRGPVVRPLLAAHDLCSGDSLVLQDPDNDAAVFSLAFRGVVRRNLIGGAHGARSQDVGQRNPALLLQESVTLAARSWLSFWFRAAEPTAEA